MHESAELLNWVRNLYDWLGVEHHAPGANIQQRLASSKMAFESSWWEFLPLERESIVDALFRAYCWTCAVGTVHPDQAVYATFRSELGLGTSPASHPVHDPRYSAAYTSVTSVVNRIVAIYADATSDNLVHDVEQAEEARDWAADLLSPVGIDVAKLARLGPAAINALLGMLAAVETRVRTFQRHPEGMPRVRFALPRAEPLLLQAQLAVESPEQRLHVFRSVLDNFNTLYGVGNLSNPAPGASRASQAMIVRDAVAVTKRSSAFSSFAGLPIEEQQHAATRARTILFTTCQEFATSRELADASRVTHEFLSLLLPHHMRRDFSEVRNEFPTVWLHSLAHAASSPPEISDRKARRYYGTTARAWEARRSAAGL
ncbi:hypothetical protein JCM10450v2_006618 [Rhodotorula kratochvilovae]